MDNLDFSAELDFDLYHYTSIDTLFNIVENSKSIRASCVSYMNDSKEFAYGLNFLEEIAATRLKVLGEKIEAIQLAGQQETKRDSILHVALKILLKLHIKQSKESPLTPYFSFSLSRQENLLSQWRSYTPHSGGVSIGFSPDKIREITSNGHISLVKCIYVKEEQEEYINRLLDDYLEIFLAKFPDMDNLQYSEKLHEWLNAYLIRDVSRCLLLLKHPTFKEEEEWRLISQFCPDFDKAGVKYQSRNNFLFPYIDIGLGGHPFFSSVLLGPSAHSKLSLQSLANYLAREMPEMPIESCGIPYREW